jgi:ATP-dependent DNA ligase
MTERAEIAPASCDGRCKNPAVTKIPQEVIVQEKLDGHRALLHVSKKFERAFLTSRRISVKTKLFAENGANVPHLMRLAHSNAVTSNLSYTVLDGEILVPGYPRESLQTVMGSLPENAQEWQQKNAVAVLRVFDVILLDGRDARNIPYETRLCILEAAISKLDPTQEFIQLVPHEVMRSPEEIQVAFETIVSAGGEGLVIKDSFGRYGKGWTKMKKEATYDCVITGFDDGEVNGKFQAMIGAVRFGIYKHGQLHEVGKCSGMVDGDVCWLTDHGFAGTPNRKGSWIESNSCVQPEGSRAWFTKNRDKLLGAVVEVKGNGLTVHGNILNPQFIRMRPDKNPKDCTKLQE